ncbi:MAG: ribonuclease M5 [Erysipelotrichia bacterium]|jgi:ribonuclease M5|nr:ribonuclease M5 [Bacilli bacterium]MDD4005559.1 ribonuclease M5 [Bacilli bacterium]NMV82158.1 ribonuclease M5 [Erysipelotrichia bacterium]
MSKRKIEAIIVVEGKSDIAFLSSFLEAEFVETNGSDVPESTIDYLKKQSTSKTIIVLTDPDFPGHKIRTELDDKITNLKHVFINKKDAIKNGKVGVAETSKNAVLEALNFPLEKRADSNSELTANDLYNLGLSGLKNSHHIRAKVAERFHLGFVNAKHFLKRARSMNITYQQIQEAINEIQQ